MLVVVSFTSRIVSGCLGRVSLEGGASCRRLPIMNAGEQLIATVLGATRAQMEEARVDRVKSMLVVLVGRKK